MYETLKIKKRTKLSYHKVLKGKRLPFKSILYILRRGDEVIFEKIPTAENLIKMSIMNLNTPTSVIITDDQKEYIEKRN